jgi:CheY-like chemotaxis protein
MLLVNDNDILLSILNSRFSLDFSVEKAQNGFIALNIVKNKPRNYFDLILLDIDMPIMNGFEAIKHIKTYLEGSPIAKFMNISRDPERASRNSLNRVSSHLS